MSEAAADTPKKKGLAGKLALVALGCLVAFGLLELVFRLLPAPDGFRERVTAFSEAVLTDDPTLGHRVVPGSSVEVGGVSYRFSIEGNRGPAPEAPEGRVLLIGDSVAMGWGVAEADTFAARLQQALGVEVVNAAVLGYGITQEAAWLEELLPRFAPRRVLVAYYPNDPEAIGEAGGSSWSAAWRFLGPRLKALGVSLGLVDTATEHHAALHAPGSEGWARVEAGLQRIAEACQAHGVRCGVALLPELLTQPYPLADVHARVAAAARERGLEVTDLAPAVADTELSTLWVAPDDSHPNAAGHALYAGALATWMASW